MEKRTSILLSATLALTLISSLSLARQQGSQTPAPATTSAQPQEPAPAVIPGTPTAAPAAAQQAPPAPQGQPQQQPNQGQYSQYARQAQQPQYSSPAQDSRLQQFPGFDSYQQNNPLASFVGHPIVWQDLVGQWVNDCRPQQFGYAPTHVALDPNVSQQGVYTYYGPDRNGDKRVVFQVYEFQDPLCQRPFPHDIVRYDGKWSMQDPIWDDPTVSPLETSWIICDGAGPKTGPSDPYRGFCYQKVELIKAFPNFLVKGFPTEGGHEMKYRVRLYRVERNPSNPGYGPNN